MDSIGGVKFNQQLNYAGGASSTTKKAEAREPETTKDQVSLGQNKEDGAIKPHKSYLFFNYIAADCNLTQFQVANIDQQEMCGSDANTHMVAFVDVGPKPSPMAGPDQEGKVTPGQWSGARTYYITKDDQIGKINSEVIAEHGDHVDMSHPDTLTNALTDAIKKFPADNVVVIFNDHGGGFTGAMSDDTDGGFMSMPQMREAFEKVELNTGVKPKIIGYDACLMAGTEVAYELRDRADILLASQETESGPGWTYNEMLQDKKKFEASVFEAIQKTQEKLENNRGINVPPEEFAKTVVEVNAKHNDDIPTFSAVDLHAMNNLKEKVDGLADAIIKTDDKASVKQAILKAENYGGGWDPYKDMRDLDHVARNVIATSSDENLKKASEDVRKALNEAVMFNEVNPQEHPESKGLHIYAPSKSLGPNYRELQFTKDSKWEKALASLGVKFDEGLRSPNVWPDGTPRKTREE